VEISGERTIVIHQAAVTESDQGVMAILDLNAPTIGEISVFRVKTAVSGQSLKEIQNSPRVTVEGLDKAVLSIEPRVFVPNRGSYTDTDGFLIEFNVPTNSDVVLRLYNIEGRVVRTLLDEEQYAGPGQVVWNGRDELRGVVPMGVYICHLEATDRDKGITTTDQAPIVVGTPLN
jgi:flagellar hook assembly protein FlgD